jgi:TolB-like protein
MLEQAYDIEEKEIHAACENILESNDFAKAFRMRRLLKFLVDYKINSNGANLSEYIIGIEVFDRKPEDYVSEDPIVRVQVGRLRKRLMSFYAKKHVHEGIEINIPYGQYLPIFRRKAFPLPCDTRTGYLVAKPIRYIAEREDGRAFACGLYEELLHKLFASFGDVCTPAALSLNAASSAVDAAEHPHRAKHCHLIEGSVRIDAGRIRTSIRLVDHALSRIKWVGHFDRSIQFGITEQEELAASICSTLEKVVPNLE